MAVLIRSGLPSPSAFDQISEFLNISKEELDFLNPIFKSNIIPAYNGKTYSLRLPKDLALKFAENEQSIYNFKSKSGLEKEKLVAEIKKATDKQYHTVRSGESLGLIARKYNVSVKQLQQWNNMRGTMIHPGQKLVVIPSSSYAYVPSSTSTSTSNLNRSTQLRLQLSLVNQILLARIPLCQIRGKPGHPSPKNTDARWKISKPGITLKTIRFIPKQKLKVSDSHEADSFRSAQIRPPRHR